MNAFVIHKTYLHVYEGFLLKVVVKAPDPITDFVLCTRNFTEESFQTWRVVILTSSNCVYRTDLSNDLSNEETETSNGRDSNSNLNIFSDLLHREEAGSISVSPVADNVILLEPYHVILRTDDLPIHIEVVGNLLLILLSGTPNKIRAYKLDDIQTDSQERNIFADFELVCPSFQFDTITDKHGLYVVTSDGSGSGWMSTNAVILSSTLFAAIFKSEAALLQSPVILYTLNGCVFYHQIKSLSQSEELWHILSNIEGSVKSILHVRWKPKDDESDLPFAALQPQRSKSNSGLLVCSSTGKTIYVYQGPTEARLAYDIVLFPGPVLSCQANKNCVYHSTGRRIYRHVIKTGASLSGASSSGASSEGDRSASLETELLHESWVDRFAVAREKENDRLLCQSPSGEIMTLSAQKETGNREHTQGSNSFKELLTGLNNNTTKLSDIQDKQKHVNDFFQQVSIAGHLLSKESKQGKAKTVSCACIVSSVMNGYTRAYSLVCKLTNHGSLALSNDWSWMVVMEMQDQSGTETRSHGMPLSHGLKSGSSMEMRAPIDSRCLSSVYLDVKVYLVLYSDLLEDLDSFQLNAPVPQTSSLSLPIPVSSHRLDILHYLHQPITEVVSTAVPSAGKSLSSLVRKQPVISQRSDAAQASCQLYSINMCARGVTLPEDIGELVLKDSLDVKILRYLLKDSQVDLNSINRGQLQLVDPSDHLISIAVATDPQGRRGGILNVQLGSEGLELLAQCRMAIVQRLQAMTCEEEGGVTVKQMRQYLSKMESLKEDVGKLKDQQKLSSAVSGDFGRLYEKLRNTQL